MSIRHAHRRGAEALRLPKSQATVRLDNGSGFPGILVSGRLSQGETALMIELQDVSVTYRNGVEALRDITISVDPGEFVFLVGATGSGKSSLLKLLYREESPRTGKVFVAGRNVARLRPWEVPLFRRHIGVVFQDFRLLPYKTVFENVAFALQVTGANRRDIRQRVPDILRLVGLDHKSRCFPDQLSGGEQQRVSIARALVNAPALLVADEPTGNLDPTTSIEIFQLLNAIHREGTTVVVATHDAAIVDRMQKRVITFQGGRIIRDVHIGRYDEDRDEILRGLEPEERVPEPIILPPLGVEPAVGGEEVVASCG
jgi:cell division transport system ATP-binding protein